MPAITADTLTLPRVQIPDPATTMQRPVHSVTTAPSSWEGDGFPVRRVFAWVSPEALDPFIHMDEIGAIDWAAGEPKGTPWHPHRGFETVTYIIDGAFEHTDSHGGGGTITNGDTQWMTAGSGILHIEQPPERLVVSGGLFHGAQLWVNLPRAKKFVSPRYQDIRAKRAVLLSSADGGALLRLIAGEVAGHIGPGLTHTPITYVHATVSPGARLTIPWPVEFNCLAYVLAGTGTVGTTDQPIQQGQLAVFDAGDAFTMAARARQSAAEPTLEVLLLGGLPIREPVVHVGPFVMNTLAEVYQAQRDYRAGRFGAIASEHLPGSE